MARVSNPALAHRIGWFASIMAIVMYGSFVQQIGLNLAGHPGSLLLPIAAAVNATAWTAYGVLKTPRDWKIVTCNVPGIVFGVVTAITAVV